MALDNQNFPVELLAHCKDEQEKEVFKGQLNGAKSVLDRYVTLVEKRIIKTEDITMPDYDCPSWSHKQADKNGYNRALKEILKLIPRP